MKTLFILILLALHHSLHAQTIHGKVVDAETKEKLPARIVIRDDTGHVYNSYYSKLNGFFTEEDGTFSQELKPGSYSMEVFHGIDYLSQKISFSIKDKSIDTTISLQPWYRLKQHGWYNGDGHDHLYTDKKPDTSMLRLVRKICIAQGVDFMCTAQGWAGYNDSTWQKGYAAFSDENFYVSYGSEMPKYRTGHTWWLGQKSTHGLFDQTMDTTYENQYYQSEEGTTWDFEHLPFPNIPDVEMVNRIRRADNALAVAAHPTSWWMQKRGNIEKYVTNVACNLSFGLLSGKIWDGIVAMGYDHDHYYYQNLWFNILNQGYRMPAFSELDGGLGKDDKFYYGSMRTYFHIEGEFSMDKMLASAKKGKSFMTSGPIILAKIDGRFEAGDIIPAGKKRNLRIDAYASGEQDDHLSYIVVFRNGKIYKLWDVRNEKKRTFTDLLQINENDKSWYIIKVYGKHAWTDPGMIDVMGVCEKKITGEQVDGEADVAFTNPFYFRRKMDKDPQVLMSKVQLLLTDSAKRIAPVQGTIDILVTGQKIKTVTIKNGTANFKMPVNAVIKIMAKGYRDMYRSLYLDYTPHRDLIEELSSGRWKRKYNSVDWQPGEVPWGAFNYEKTKKILSNVKWKIELKKNERDLQYEKLKVN